MAACSSRSHDGWAVLSKEAILAGCSLGSFYCEGELAVVVQLWSFVALADGASTWQIKDDLYPVFSADILDVVCWWSHTAGHVKVLMPAHVWAIAATCCYNLTKVHMYLSAFLLVFSLVSSSTFENRFRNHVKKQLGNPTFFTRMSRILCWFFVFCRFEVTQNVF